MKMFRYVGLLAGLTACQALPERASTQPQAAYPLSWLEGCWETQNGTRERWQGEGPDILFGSSVTFQDEDIVFFEQTRIELKGDAYVFSAYPRGIGPSDFAEQTRGETMISFANREHDYPQKITYQRLSDGRLEAVISLMDGTMPNSWRFAACS